MANTDLGYGLRPVRTLTGADVNGLVTSVVIPASDGSAVFIGSPVKLDGSADTTERLAGAILAGAGDRVFGVVVGFDALPSNLMQKHRAASTKRIARVVPATQNVVFEINADEAFPVTEVGQNFDLTAESGSATTGRSTVELDVSTGATTTAQVQAIGIARDPDTEFGTGAGTNVHVIFNESDTADVGAV